MTFLTEQIQQQRKETWKHISFSITFSIAWSPRPWPGPHSTDRYTSWPHSADSHGEFSNDFKASPSPIHSLKHQKKQICTIYFKNPFLLRANHPSRQSAQKFFHAFLLLKNQNASYLYSQLPNTPHLPCRLILDAQGHSSPRCHCNSLSDLLESWSTEGHWHRHGRTQECTLMGSIGLFIYSSHQHYSVDETEVDSVKTCSKLAQVLPWGW